MIIRCVGVLTSVALLLAASFSAAAPPAKTVDFNLLGPAQRVIFNPLMPSANAFYGATVTNNGAAVVDDVMVRFVLPPPEEFTPDPDADTFSPSCDLGATEVVCAVGSLPSGQSTLVFFAGRATGAKPHLCIDGQLTWTSSGTEADDSARLCARLLKFPHEDPGTGFHIGDIAHDFTLRDQSGHSLSLLDLRGNFVLLNFTTLWCAPSRQEVPNDVREIATLNEQGILRAPIAYVAVVLQSVVQ